MLAFARHLHRLSSLIGTLPRAIAALLAVVGLFAVVAAPMAGDAHGAMGLLALAVAAGVCTSGAVAALVIAWLARGGEYAVAGLLCGMLVRTAGPLALLAYFSQHPGPLVAANLLGLLVIFFLVCLLTETVLSVALVGPALQKGQAAR